MKDGGDPNRRRGSMKDNMAEEADPRARRNKEREEAKEKDEREKRR